MNCSTAASSAGAVRVRPTALVNPPERNRYVYQRSASSPSMSAWTECADDSSVVIQFAPPSDGSSSASQITATARSPINASPAPATSRVHSTTEPATGSPDAMPSTNGSVVPSYSAVGGSPGACVVGGAAVVVAAVVAGVEEVAGVDGVAPAGSGGESSGASATLVPLVVPDEEQPVTITTAVRARNERREMGSTVSVSHRAPVAHGRDGAIATARWRGTSMVGDEVRLELALHGLAVRVARERFIEEPDLDRYLERGDPGGDPVA